MLEPSPEPVWVVGPVTWDHVGADRRAGGTASYVARLCEAMDVRASMLVLGGGDAPMEALAGHEVVRLGSATLEFQHEFEGAQIPPLAPSPARGEGARAEGAQRVQRLVQGTDHTVRVADVPSTWGEPSTLILAPLLPEQVDVLDFIDEYPQAEVAVLAQGLQRAVVPDEAHTVMHRAQPSSVLLDAARPNVSVFLSREETALWPAGALEHVAARAGRVVVTDGERGAAVMDRRGSRHVDAVPADVVVDATGAGDVFAAAYILGLRAGEQVAGRLAAAYAAAAVEVVGPAPLPSRSAIDARLSQLDRGPSS